MLTLSSLRWQKVVESFLGKTEARLSYIVNMMATDGLAIKEPGQQEPYYWHIYPRIFQFQHWKGKISKLLVFNSYTSTFVQIVREHPGYGLSQWETTLQCNVVSHWLSSYPEWSLGQLCSWIAHCIISANIKNKYATKFRCAFSAMLPI